MFEVLFIYPMVLARPQVGPAAADRERYLAHRAGQGVLPSVVDHRLGTRHDHADLSGPFDMDRAVFTGESCEGTNGSEALVAVAIPQPREASRSARRAARVEPRCQRPQDGRSVSWIGGREGDQLAKRITVATIAILFCNVQKAATGLRGHPLSFGGADFLRKVVA
jgi:hypothetical protein